MKVREYPEGRINGEDEGATQIATTYDRPNNVFVMKFLEPMGWIGLGPGQVLWLLRKLANVYEEMTGGEVLISTPEHLEEIASMRRVYLSEDEEGE